MAINSRCAEIAAWLNDNLRGRDGVGMNIPATGRSVKRFEQSQGLDTALHKNAYLPFVHKVYCSMIRCHLVCHAV